MRSERLYLTDIIAAIDAIERFLQGIDEASFMQDELRQSAVLQKLIVIGEAAARLPKAFTDKHPGIPWPDIVGFRNIAVHAYLFSRLADCLDYGNAGCSPAAPTNRQYSHAVGSIAPPSHPALPGGVPFARRIEYNINDN